MSFAQQIIAELGTNGGADVTTQLKGLQDAIDTIQSATNQLVNGTGAGAGNGAGGPSLTQDTIDKLTTFLNDQAKKAGMEKTLSVASLATNEAKDMEKVNEKLEEINAKIAALREAMNVQDIVVKSYYESE